MSLTQRFLLALLSLLPLATQAQFSQGPASSNSGNDTRASQQRDGSFGVSPSSQSRQTQRPTDQAERPTGQTQRSTGQTQRSTGPSQRATGQADRATGQADRATGQADRATGQADRPMGPTDNAEPPEEDPSEFQIFVEQSTGRLLPRYGFNLFTRAPSTFAPVDNIPVTQDYAIGPGDEILISVWGQIDGEHRVEVDRNGSINIPKVGTINVAGIKIQDLEGYVRNAIGRNFRNFDLNVSLGQLRSIQIFIVGQASRPGSYTGVTNQVRYVTQVAQVASCQRLASDKSESDRA